jgi:hypothetical protein
MGAIHDNTARLEMTLALAQRYAGLLTATMFSADAERQHCEAAVDGLTRQLREFTHLGLAVRVWAWTRCTPARYLSSAAGALRVAVDETAKTLSALSTRDNVQYDGIRLIRRLFAAVDGLANAVDTLTGLIQCERPPG